MPESPGFTGWLRIVDDGKPKGLWLPACQDRSWGKCWRLLLLAARAGGAQNIEATVTDGRNPGHDRRPR